MVANGYIHTLRMGGIYMILQTYIKASHFDNRTDNHLLLYH